MDGVRTLFRYTLCLVALALVLPAASLALPSLASNPANKLLSRGMDPGHYDDATHCNGGKVQPGTKAMVAWLEYNAAGVNWGEYRCEMWGKGSASLHSEGRAIDWHPSSKSAALKLVHLLLAPDKAGNGVALARRMGVQGIIFDCQAWWGSQDGRMGNYSYCYGKNGKRKKHLDPTQAHMNHVHIELNKRGAAKKTTFWDRSVTYPVEDLQQPAQQPQPQSQSRPAYPTPGGGSGWQGNGGSWDQTRP